MKFSHVALGISFLAAGIGGIATLGPRLFEDGCYHSIKGIGEAFPNKSAALAAAISTWTRLAAVAANEGYSVGWHSAERKVIKCQPLSQARLIACLVRAKPCGSSASTRGRSQTSVRGQRSYPL